MNSVCVCVCVRACVRACVRVCVRARACVRVLGSGWAVFEKGNIYWKKWRRVEISEMAG